MSHEADSPSQPAETNPAADTEPQESFGDILRDFERSHKSAGGARQLEGTIISVSGDQVFLDIGLKIEGVLPRSAFAGNAADPVAGAKVPVSVRGRNAEGYYQLSRFQVSQPRDWTALEEAFAKKLAVAGTVTGVVKGGLTIDVGVRAFMPASRSGTRDAAEMEKLVGTEITCRITKLDVTSEDVVVDRRVVLEEQSRLEAQGRLAALRAGDTTTGTVRTLTSYGAFIDIGGTEGLLHISDIAWGHVSKPEDFLAVGQEVRVRILKIDAETNKIGLGLKQLEPEPWEKAPAKYAVGQRTQGTVTRLADFGAFVEIEPGVEGLIHVSEMSWGKKVRHPGDVVKPGDRVDAIILDIKPQERRISLGLKQTLCDPWSAVRDRFPVGSTIEGPVTKLMKFGAFVELVDGIEGMVHISEITADRRINHPQEVLRAGQRVKAQVLAIDGERRQIKLSMKQLVPTSLDEYLAEHKNGDVVSGRVVALGPQATVELGEGIRVPCRASASGGDRTDSAKRASAGEASLSSLTSLLAARWKGSAPVPSASPEPLQVGQVRSFRIVKLDAAARQIEVETP